MSPTLLTNAYLIEQVKKLPDLLESDDITGAGMYWLWLSRAEWELIYSLSMAMEGAGLIERPQTLHDTMIAAMLYVQELGFEFKGCRATEERRVLRTRHGLVEPRNVMTMRHFELGRAADYEVHFARAVFLAQHHYRNENLLDLLRAAQNDIEATLATMPKPPQEFREAVQMRAAKLRELAQKTGTDLSSPEAIENLFRADAEDLTLEEELD